MFKNLVLKVCVVIKNIFLGACLSFCPTCSEYTYQAIEKYGILSGSWRGLKRIMRCHPWSKEEVIRYEYLASFCINRWLML
jgi:hypothetical protein